MTEPTTAVSAMPGRVDVGNLTPYTKRPKASSTVKTVSETVTAVRVRPATSTHAGTGVARRRLRIPPSRCAVIEITRLTNEAAITPSAPMPGT